MEVKVINNKLYDFGGVSKVRRMNFDNRPLNNKFYLEVISSGQNFKRNGYNIIINKIEWDNILEICDAEIKSINNDIELGSALYQALGKL